MNGTCKNFHPAFISIALWYRGPGRGFPETMPVAKIYPCS